MTKPVLSLSVYIGPTHTFESGWGSFSPTTSTLIMGETDAILVDAQHIKADVKALGDMIERSGRRLTQIYLTHGHADHYYGIGELTHRFPTAKAVAVEGVADYIDKDKENAKQAWKTMFGDRVVDNDVFPKVIRGSLELEGHALPIVEVGQGDIENCTVLHVPQAEAVIPGDIVYNKCHMMLGLTTPDQWELWIDSIDQIERLKPKIVVCGHKRQDMPDDDAQRMLDESRAYIRFFADTARKSADEHELVSRVVSKYPEFANLWTLQFSARQVFERARSGSA